jgi:hypothetical protein
MSRSVLPSVLAFGGVGLGFGVVAEPAEHDGVQRAVGLPVPAAVEPVPVGFAGGDRDGAGAAEGCEAGGAGHLVGVVAGGDQ